MFQCHTDKQASDDQEVLLMNLTAKHILKLFQSVQKQLNGVYKLKILRLIIKFFMNQEELSENQIFKTIICELSEKQNERISIETINDIYQSRNLYGRILKHKNHIILQEQYLRSFYDIIKYLLENKKEKTMYISQYLLAKGWLCIIVTSANIKHQYFLNNIIKFKQYLNKLRYKYRNQALIKKQLINKHIVDKYYSYLLTQKDLNLRNYTIKMLYEQYTKEKINLVSCYQLMQYLMTISNSQFQQEFHVDDENNVSKISSFLKEYKAQDINQLRFRASVAKHIEFSAIGINLSKNFLIEDISNDVIISMLENVEQRLLWFAVSEYVIIRRISDNYVYKVVPIQDNIEEIEEKLQSFSDNQLYDVIIRSKHLYKNLGKLKMRYLQFMNRNTDKQSLQLELQHPEDLITTSLFRTQISNLCQCINLRNLYSNENYYNINDIQPLKSLIRFRSYNDEYNSDNSYFVKDLLINKNLEYVNFFNSILSNIIGSNVLSENIEKLRYFNIEIEGVKHNITFDITKNYPQNMHLLNIETNGKERGEDPDDIQRGIVLIPEHKRASFERQLVHRLEQN